MKYKLLVVSSLLAGSILAACSTTTTNSAVTSGQLFCAKATTDGPLVVALADAFGAPVVVTGLASAVVAADCAAINAVPVSPPTVPASVPTVSVTLPAS